MGVAYDNPTLSGPFHKHAFQAFLSFYDNPFC